MATRRGPTEAVLGRRALNRALLARQLLLRRAKLPVLRALEHLVGLQAQVPNSPYLGLWTRLQGFRPEPLARALEERRVVRGALLRGTLHLASARDYLGLRPLLQPVLTRALDGNFGRRLEGLDRRRVAAAGRALLAAQPLGGDELGRRLARRWPGRGADALAYAVQYQEPLVQLPPRGLWGRSGRPVWTTAEAWLGRALGAGYSDERLVLRFLAAFGPAAAADVRTWSGLPGSAETLERLRRRLRVFRDEAGRELFDLPAAPRPAPASPAPTRFLPCYDNALLSHSDRSRIVAPEHERLFSRDGLLVGSVLLDGFVGARWRVEREGARARLVVEPFGPLSRADRRGLDEEGTRLLAFLAADAPRRAVAISRPL